MRELWQANEPKIDTNIGNHCHTNSSILDVIHGEYPWYLWSCWMPYIYIYIRQGEEVPREDVNQDHWIGEKQCFTVVKWRFFMSFFSLLMSFNYVVFFFSSVEVEVNYGPSQYVFFGVLSFSIGITRCAFCAISKIIGKGYCIIYCVSTGILMWCCFSLVIHSDFAYHQNFRVLWVSRFFCFYTRALVQDISTTIEGTNPTNSNVILCKKTPS